MNKKRMLDEVQGLKRRVDSLENQLREEREERRQMSKEIHRDITNNTELHLPVPGMQTLSVPGDPQGRRYVKVVDLMLAIMRQLELTLEYEPCRYTLKERRKKE